MANKNLTQAKKNKNDEFYTRLTDIEKELVHYREHFRDKVVYCNCDDPEKSQFFVYFRLNFEKFGLKKLICTGYNEGGKGRVCVYCGGDVVVKDMEGNGDFRSDECVKYLKESDIVVTNPPFSLFREFVNRLIDYNKKFIIIGNLNAIKYKELFPLIKENKIWLGYGGNITMEFILSDDYEKWDRIEEGRKIGKVPAISWFTNVEHDKRNHPLDLYKKYKSSDYPKYDNFEGIEVSKTCDIPMDYEGVMGVPISFLDKYCPEQFEIIDLLNRYMIFDSFDINDVVKYNKSHCCNINGIPVYSRILIKHKQPQTNI